MSEALFKIPKGTPVPFTFDMNVGRERYVIEFPDREPVTVVDDTEDNRLHEYLRRDSRIEEV